MFQDVTKECPAILFSTWQWLVLCIWCPSDKYTPFLCLWNNIIWNMDANLFVKSVAGRNIRMSFKIIQFFTFIILWAEYNFRWYLGNIYHSVIHIYIFWDLIMPLIENLFSGCLRRAFCNVPYYVLQVLIVKFSLHAWLSFYLNSQSTMLTSLRNFQNIFQDVT